MGLTHLDKDGNIKMVDVTEKRSTEREATARGSVYMKATTLSLIRDKAIPKGDVVAVARIAGILAAKKTSDLIPLCHPLNVTSVNVTITIDKEENRVEVEAKAKTMGQTGVEMEALTAVSVAALTIYDMCKAVDRGMVIEGIRLLEKRGGKSGDWRADVLERDAS